MCISNLSVNNYIYDNVDNRNDNPNQLIIAKKSKWSVILIFWQWIAYSDYGFCSSFYGYLLTQNSNIDKTLEILTTNNI